MLQSLIEEHVNENPEDELTMKEFIVDLLSKEDETNKSNTLEVPQHDETEPQEVVVWYVIVIGACLSADPPSLYSSRHAGQAAWAYVRGEC